MRNRLIIVGIIFVATAVVLVGALRSGEDGSDRTPAAFSSRTVDAGAVTVKMQPHHVDGTGAEIKVTLDTHSVDLGMDLVAAATLEVGGVRWPAIAWDGDGSGGHHRAGLIRFDAAGPAAGTVELRLTGFPRRVEATWEESR